MRGLPAFAVIAFLLAGCDDDPTPEPWVGEPDEFELDDTRALATELLIHGRTERHTFSPDGDIDWIRFRVTEVGIDAVGDPMGPFCQMGLLGVVGSTRLGLYSPQALIYEHPISMSWWCPRPGIYYLQVTETTGSGGEYRPFVSCWRDDGYPDLVATSVVCPAEVASGSSHTLTLRLGNMGYAAAPSVDLVPYVSLDRVVDSSDCEIIGRKLVATTPWRLDPDFPLPVEFTPALGEPDPLPTGPVYILVQIGPLANEITAHNDWNNVALGSTLIDMPEPYTESEPATVTLDGTTQSETQAGRHIYPAGDLDELTLDVNTSVFSWYEVWTEKLRGGANTAVEIRDSLGQLVAAAEDGGPENGATYIRHQFSATDTYTVGIVDEDVDSTGAYDLHVRASAMEPDGSEPDDTFEPALGYCTWRTLTAGFPVSRSFHAGGYDVDYMAYGVSWDEGGRTHKIETRNVSGCETRLTLYAHDAPRGRVVGTGLAGAGGTWVIEQTLAAGLYYVRIENIAGTITEGTYEIVATLP